MSEIIERGKIKGALGLISWTPDRLSPLNNEWNNNILKTLAAYSREVVSAVAEEIYPDHEVQAIISLLERAESLRPEEEREADVLAGMFAVATMMYLEQNPKIRGQQFNKILELALMKTAEDQAASDDLPMAA